MHLLILLAFLGHSLIVSPRSDVPIKANEVSQWQATVPYGSTALLAHNYLAGGYFYELQVDDKIQLTYDDGGTRNYIVNEIVTVPPDFNNFAVFHRVYFGNRLVLQTCTDDGGRLFVIALPVPYGRVGTIKIRYEH